MGLFGFGKKEKTCSCGGNCSEAPSKEESAWAKVLGTGCTKCNELEKATKQALIALGMEAKVEHITDFKKILEFGVMTTPALVLGDEVVSLGKSLKKEEITTLITTKLAKEAQG